MVAGLVVVVGEFVAEPPLDLSDGAELTPIGTVRGNDAVLPVDQYLGLREGVQQVEQIAWDPGFNGFSVIIGSHGSYVMPY